MIKNLWWRRLLSFSAQQQVVRLAWWTNWSALRWKSRSPSRQQPYKTAEQHATHARMQEMLRGIHARLQPLAVMTARTFSTVRQAVTPPSVFVIGKLCLSLLSFPSRGIVRKQEIMLLTTRRSGNRQRHTVRNAAQGSPVQFRAPHQRWRTVARRAPQLPQAKEDGPFGCDCRRGRFLLCATTTTITTAAAPIFVIYRVANEKDAVVRSTVGRVPR